MIWVEGPSDRIYINHWISLWEEGELKEGKQYQCVFYGGSRLKHLEAGSPDEYRSGVAILRLARYAFVVIDSDRENENAPINDTKKRIVSEIESVGLKAWVTKGRKIENYIPPAAFRDWKGWTLSEPRDPYEDVFNAMTADDPSFARRTARKAASCQRDSTLSAT